MGRKKLDASAREAGSIPVRSTKPGTHQGCRVFLSSEGKGDDVMRDYGILTRRDAVSLAAVLSCVQRKTKVARSIDGYVYIGEARGITGERGDHGADDENTDVRGQYVWVTLDAGVEAFWKISDLMADYPQALFVPDYVTPAVL